MVETLGEAPRGMERMTYGHCNTVYDVTLANRNVIVRTNMEPHVLAGTERTIAALAALDEFLKGATETQPYIYLLTTGER